MHRFVLAGTAVDEAGDELDKTLSGFMSLFFFHQGQADPLGILEAVDDPIAPFSGMTVGMSGSYQIIYIVFYVSAKTRTH